MSRRAWTRGAGFWIIVDGACSEWCATDLHHAEEKMKFSARNCESSWKWRAKVPTWQHNRIKSIYVQFFILRENPTMFWPLETENHASLWECGVVLVLFTQLYCKVKHCHLYVSTMYIWKRLNEHLIFRWTKRKRKVLSGLENYYGPWNRNAEYWFFFRNCS